MTVWTKLTHRHADTHIPYLYSWKRKLATSDVAEWKSPIAFSAPPIFLGSDGRGGIYSAILHVYKSKWQRQLTSGIKYTVLSESVCLHSSFLKGECKWREASSQGILLGLKYSVHGHYFVGQIKAGLRNYARKKHSKATSIMSTGMSSLQEVVA